MAIANEDHHVHVDTTANDSSASINIDGSGSLENQNNPPPNQNNPPPQSPTDTVIGSITNHRLNGDNYLQWSSFVLKFISGKGKKSYISGKMVAPAEEDPCFTNWEIEDNMVQSWLFNSMTTSIGEKFLLHKTAFDIWDSARHTYSNQSNTAQLFEIEMQLHDLIQRDMTVTQYYDVLSKHWMQQDLIMGRFPLPEVRDAFAEVKREESRRKLMIPASKEPAQAEGSALAVNYSNKGQNRGFTKGGRPRPQYD
ncbi:hypothetical protein LINGRAHAP2_LOCUS33667 [Linum grandiflorum]